MDQNDTLNIQGNSFFYVASHVHVEMKLNLFLLRAQLPSLL